MSTEFMNKPLHPNEDYIYLRNYTENFSTSDQISSNIHSPISYFGNLQAFCFVSLISVLFLVFFKYFITKRKKSETLNGKCSVKMIPKLRHKFSIGIPLLDGVYTLHLVKTVGVHIFDQWCAKVGPLFQLPVGPVNMYFVGDASVAQTILSSSQPAHLNKPTKLYGQLFLEWFRDGLVNSEYEIWSPHRKMLSRCFTYKSLQHYLKIMNKHGKNLVNKLSSVAVEEKDNENIGILNSSVVQGEQIHEIIYFQLMKIIAQIVIGSDDKLSDGTLSEWTHNFRRLKCLVLERFLNPILFFPPYWHFHSMKKDYDRCIKYTTEFFHKIIQVYRKEHEDFLKMNLNAKIVNNEEVRKDNDVGEKEFRCVIQEMLFCNATDKEIYDEVGTLIGAGHETIIIAIHLLLVQLAMNQEHQEKCRQEIDEFFSKKIGSADHDDQMELKMDDLANLKYLKRCILEGLRLLPSFPIFLRRLDAPINIGNDMELGKGSNIAILPWLIHRSSKYYENPEKFDPDRFLPENVKKRHPYAFIPFSAGSRNCIGYKMALVEMRVIMMWILRNFEIESKDKIEDVKLNFEITLKPERNYNLVFRKRNIR